MILRARSMCVSYGLAQVIFDLDLDVEEGRTTAIIGPNGAGKSTLLNTISGLQRQSSGEITFRGKRIETLPTRERVKRGLVLCPERRRLFPSLKVRDNLSLGAFLRDDAKIVNEDLENVFSLFPVLRDRQGQLAGTLSGGEQQMVAIGRSLMSSPRLLMLDEPSVGLSPLMRQRIFDATARIRDMSNVTVLIVEQDAVDALSIADKVCVLESGRITLEGASAEIEGNPHVREAFLGL
jgi:branched-chain amino acid transport system ATP-binding protein